MALISVIENVKMLKVVSVALQKRVERRILSLKKLKETKFLFRKKKRAHGVLITYN
jgi:hypothetical protein